MNVWIDQDLCTGDGLCAEICPSRFVLVDGIAAVRGADGVALGSNSPALVGDDQIEDVLEAAEECPGECIFVSV